MNQYWTREDVSYSGSQFQPNLSYPSQVSLEPSHEGVDTDLA